MKKILSLFCIFALFTAFMCENEPLEDGLLNNVNNPVADSLVGDWILESVDYSGTSSVTFLGETITTTFIGESANENTTYTFNANGTYATSGSYDIVLTFTVAGITQTVTSSFDGSGSGDYTVENNTLITSGNLFSYTIDGTPTANTTPEGGASEFILSPDGQTLTFPFAINDVIDIAGISTEVSLTGTSVLVRASGVGDPDPDPNDGTLLTQLVEVSDGETFTTDFVYEGNRLIQEIYSESDSDYSYTTTFQYENDVLVGSVSVYNDLEEITETYSYDNQNRVSQISITVPGGTTSTYNLTYNSNNTIIDYYSEGFLIVTYTLSNNNMISSIENNDDDDFENYTYTYDTMNSPFKNVELREVFITLDTENIFNSLFSVNNILTENNESGSFPDTLTTFDYTYNAQGYPVSAIVTEDTEGDVSTSTYTFTYNN